MASKATIVKIMDMDKQKISRRQLLMGLGTAALAALASALGALGGFILWLLGRRKANIVVEQAVTATPPAPQPQIVSRAAWGAWPPDHSASNEKGFYSPENETGWLIYEGELQDHYQTLVVHHAAFDEGSDRATLAEVQRLHRLERQWADVAYHFLVGRSGSIYEGRDWHVRGTHVAGFNTGSIGICLLGNYMQQQPTAQQLTQAQWLINWLAERLQLTHIAGHRDFNTGTLCPGDHLAPYIQIFAQRAGLQAGTEGYLI